MTDFNHQGFDRLELMHTFVRIVESKNLSAAALSLRTTQPTISRRLKGLEESLGLKLLQRTTHRMQLTEEGQRFYHHAKDLLERWGAIEAEMSGAKTSPTGILRVQVPQALGIGKFNSVLAAYLKSYPQVDVEWILTDKAPDFTTENLDCAIKVGHITDPAVVAVKIFELPRIIVAAKELVLASKKISRPTDLSHYPWLSFKTNYQDIVTLTNLKTQEDLKLKLRPRFTTDSLLAMREVALLGLGIGVFSRWIIEEDLKAGRLVHLCKDWQAPSLPVFLIYPQSRLKPAKLQKFIETVTTYRVPRLES